jgi:DNA mismatch endonuclease (patch repair protein)
MPDVHSTEKRSFNMSRIKGKNTKPEIQVRKFLFAQGLRYKIHDKNLPGRPDMVFPKFKKVVCINGCFWHGHDGCNFFVIPQTKTEWWLKKISDTKRRDVKNVLELEARGWTVITIWECELKPATKNAALNLLLNKIVA